MALTSLFPSALYFVVLGVGGDADSRCALWDAAALSLRLLTQTSILTPQADISRETLSLLLQRREGKPVLRKVISHLALAKGGA